jgi:hypothetical protein
MMEFEVESNSGKIWLLRKVAEAYLDNDRPEKARELVNKGLEKRPDDKKLEMLKTEVEKELKGE